MYIFWNRVSAIALAMTAVASVGCDSGDLASRFGPECPEAVRYFDQTNEALLPVVRRYAFCLSSNDGDDRCEAEFERLAEAHWILRQAVSHRASVCKTP